MSAYDPAASSVQLSHCLLLFCFWLLCHPCILYCFEYIQVMMNSMYSKAYSCFCATVLARKVETSRVHTKKRLPTSWNLAKRFHDSTLAQQFLTLDFSFNVCVFVYLAI
jgi:hypothetical protein